MIGVHWRRNRLYLPDCPENCSGDEPTGAADVEEQEGFETESCILVLKSLNFWANWLILLIMDLCF